jgi:hypothetical protein
MNSVGTFTAQQGKVLKERKKKKEKKRMTECDKRHLRAVYVVGGFEVTLRGAAECVFCSKANSHSKFCYG